MLRILAALMLFLGVSSASADPFQTRLEKIAHQINFVMATWFVEGHSATIAFSQTGSSDKDMINMSFLLKAPGKKAEIFEKPFISVGNMRRKFYEGTLLVDEELRASLLGEGSHSLELMVFREFHQFMSQSFKESIQQYTQSIVDMLAAADRQKALSASPKELYTQLLESFNRKYGLSFFLEDFEAKADPLGARIDSVKLASKGSSHRISIEVPSYLNDSPTETDRGLLAGRFLGILVGQLRFRPRFLTVVGYGHSSLIDSKRSACTIAELLVPTATSSSAELN